MLMEGGGKLHLNGCPRWRRACEAAACNPAPEPLSAKGRVPGNRVDVMLTKLPAYVVSRPWGGGRQEWARS